MSETPPLNAEAQIEQAITNITSALKVLFAEENNEMLIKTLRAIGDLMTSVAQTNNVGSQHRLKIARSKLETNIRNLEKPPSGLTVDTQFNK